MRKDVTEPKSVLRTSVFEGKCEIITPIRRPTLSKREEHRLETGASTVSIL